MPRFTVQFTDQSTNSPATYAWDFDDNGVVDSTDRNPSYEYSKAGSYTVRLNVTNGAGTDEEVRSDCVIVSSAPSTEAPIEISSPLIPKTDGTGIGFSRYAPILIMGLVALGIGIISRRVTKTRHK